MKRSTKIIALVLAVVMVFLLIPFTTASAAKIPGGTKLYLVPSANWNQSNARFAAYFFGDGDAWVSMTKVAGESNLYEVTSPAGKNFTNVIFCRMNPGNTTNGWGSNQKWNQTSDLVYNGSSNCYTVKEGTWDKGGGTWSTYGSACTHANVGPAATCTTPQKCLDCGDPVVSELGHTYNTAHLCTRCNEQASFTVAGDGAHLGTSFDPGNKANDMTYADGVYTKVYTNVAAGSYKLKVTRDHDWGTAYPSADKVYTVATAGSTVTVTLKGTTVTITVEAPHTCAFVDGVCSCGEFDPAWTVVATLEELNAALLNGGNIVLNGDITSSNVISITTSVVLNGNGHTLTYTGANRAIDVPNTALDVNLTIKNLTVNTTASFCERGINYNTNGVLTLEKVVVAGTNINYAINLPGSSDNATVVITDSNITGNIALNVWGEKVAITANNSNFTSPYESEVEACSVIQFNNDGTNAAHGASLTVNGGSIISLAETVALSVSSYDTVISISNETTVQGKQETSSIAVIYEGQTQFYTSSTLQHAFDIAANDPRAKVLLLGDVVLDAPVVVTGTVVLDLNGFELSYTSTTMGEAMITNKGNLTINDSVGTGVINYNYVGANDASYGKGNYTISNAGTLTVNGGKITIANLRQHAKYPIDNNSTTGDAILVINGGHLYNYNTSAIRQFCNSTTHKNSVTINGGLVEGYSAIWMQNPGKNTVHGALTITGGEIRTTAAAYVNGTAELKDVSSSLYTSIDGEGGAWTADSLVSITGGTLNENVNVYYEAPENVTIGAATFNGNVWFVCKHVWADATCTAPKTCSVCGETEGEALGHTWVDATFEAPKTCSVCGATEGVALVAAAKIGETNYATLADAIAAAVDGDTIVLVADIDLGTNSVTVKGKELTLDLNGHNITGSGYRVLVVDLLRVDGSDKRGVLTLTGDGTVKNTGTTTGNSYAVYVGGSSDLIVKTGVTLNSDYGFTVLMAPMGAGRTSTLTLDGGSITGRYGVSGNGTLTDTSTSVTINSGSIDCTEVGIYQPQPGTVTINGGTVSGAEAALALRRGEATITDGAIVGLVDVIGDYEASSLAINGGDLSAATLQYADGNTVTKAEGVVLAAPEGFAWINDVLVAHAEHSYEKVVTAPTCTEAGYTTYTCACGDTYTEAGEAALGHVDVAPADHECDVCGLCLTDCVDANNNHKCDICGDVMSKCADTDKNHFCDICGVQNSHCIDIPPYDHNCDWCGAKVSEHNFVEGKCDVCGEEDPNYVPPHVHSWSEATCTEPSKCECGETNGEALGHDYKYDVCSGCGAVDPAYASVTHRINFSTWEVFDKETYADGTVVKYNDVFSFIYSKNAKVDGSAKTWDDFAGTLRFSFGTKTPTGKVPNKGAIQITVDGAYTIKLWYVAGGDARYFALLDENGTVLAETTKETVKNGQGYAELVIPAAGVYYLGTPADNNYLFQIELVKHEHTAGDEATCTTAQTCTTCGAVIAEALGHTFVYGKCTVCGAADPDYVPYVNTLVVGDTNKIVVDGDTFNDYNLPIEWVAFVADEKAEYTFVGNNSALVFIFDAELNLLCGGTGKATLEAGTYLICIGNGAVGELNVAVTKTLLEVPHEHEFSDATCTEPSKCECGETQADALGHSYAFGECTRCGEADPDYVAPQPPVEEPVEETNFFQAIIDFFMMIIDFFKNLFKF